MALEYSMSMQNVSGPLSLATSFHLKMPIRYAYAATIHDLKGPQNRLPQDKTLDETYGQPFYIEPTGSITYRIHNNVSRCQSK